MTHENEALLPRADNPQTWRYVFNEFLLLFKSSIPVILAYALQNSLQTLSIIIVGRSSPENLAVAAFSYMFALATAWLVALGGSTALDTLGSAAFTGSSNPHELGILLQRTLIVLTALYIPIAILWTFSRPVFLLLGQDAEISYQSSRFLQHLIPGGLGYIFFETMKKYLQAQGIMRPGTYVLLVTSPVNIGLNILFTQHFGLIGASVATGISYWLSLLLLVIYARHACLKSWGGFSIQAFQNITPTLRLALLGIIHVGSEYWAFEIVALVAGQLGTLSLEAQSVIMTADQIINTIPFGVGIVTSARVGNLLGSRSAIGARRTANTGVCLSMVLGSILLVILLAVKDHFAKIFNDDEDVVRLTAQVLPAVAIFQIADGLNASCGGILRGMGRQHIGAAINIVSYYFCALPFGIYLAYHGWGLQGLWWGNCLALYIAGFVQWLIVAFSDWNKQVDKAIARLEYADQDVS